MGINDELTGQAVNAFVALKDGHEGNDQTKKDLILQVRKSIGPFAAPKAIFVVPDLPKTRSGKIMRRILRKILAGEEDQLGDITTVSRALMSEFLRFCLGGGRGDAYSATKEANSCGSCPTPPLWIRSSISCMLPRRSSRPIVSCRVRVCRESIVSSCVEWRKASGG